MISFQVETLNLYFTKSPYLQRLTPQVATDVCELSGQRQHIKVKHETQGKPCIRLSRFNLKATAQKLVNFLQEINRTNKQVNKTSN
jgi:hypothetical protein